jgi:Tol biopolymer transport system component/DNA-binding winged helix-turn-helix (wHTH) protein
MSGELRQNISFAEFELDTVHRRLRRDGKPLALYAKTLDLLEFLLANNGRVVTKDEILEAVWSGQFVEEANLTVQISALRKALGEPKGAPRFLVTIPGKGYKFVAPVENAPGAIVIEKHRISEITIEQETEIESASENPDFEASEEKRDNSAAVRPAKKTRTRHRRRFLRATAVILLAVAAAGLFYYTRPVPKMPFQAINPTRLTNNGRVTAAALAPDGKYFAYVLAEAEGRSLWLQQVGTASNIRLLPPVRADFWCLKFTPDGKFIYYNIFAADRANAELYRIPALGGVVERIPDIAVFAISFSPDGKRIAYIVPDSAANRNYLAIADADGTNKRVVLAKPQPNTFIFDGDFAAWSPDGARIACLVNNLKTDVNYSSFVIVNVEDGTETPLETGNLRDIGSFKWLPDGSGLLVTGKDKPSSLMQNRVWLVPYPEGAMRPLTSDLSYYDWLSPTADGKSFMALQTITSNGIFIGDAGGSEFREIVSEAGELNPLAWLPDGRIVFTSMADGTANLWTIDADGANRRQLTVGAEVNYRGMCATADGKYLIFTSLRAGKSNLWRVDAADGGNLRQLTDGEADAYPACAPDGKTVVYQRGILTQPRLWTISVEGGEPAALTDFWAKWASISPDGRLISYFHMVDDRWRIGFLSPDGQRAGPDVKVPENLKADKIYWSPDRRALFYVGSSGLAGNLWSLPRGGGEPVRLTSFSSHSLDDFEFSRDGKKLAAARSLSISDVVSIADEPAR